MTEALTCDYIRLSTGRFGNLLAPLGANLGADLLKALVTSTAGLGRGRRRPDDAVAPSATTIFPAMTVPGKTADIMVSRMHKG